MKRRGLQIRAISSPGDDLKSFAERELVEVKGIQMHRRISPLRDLFALVEILRALREWRPDIVHAHTPKGGLLGMVAAWILRVPVRVYHMRGLPALSATGAKRMLLVSTERLACLMAHRVFCVSHSLRNEAIAARICSPLKMRVFLGGSGNGVDAVERFNPCLQSSDVRSTTRAPLGIQTDDLVIGFVGRIVRDKGIVELSNAWRALRAEFPKLHLLLVGPIERQDPLPEQVEASLQEDPRVHFVGMDWDTPRYYAAMDVVVLPTYREGFPNVPLEASAMGLPVVATRVSGCVDAVLDGETGVLVTPKDSQMLASAIRTYLEDASLRARHGHAGRERVLREFAQDAIWRAIYDEYDALLSGRLARSAAE